VEAALPILLLLGGEIVLAAIGLRIAIWVALGWRACRAAPTPPSGPRGPKGGLRVLAGGAPAAAPRPRAAA
jgi:hypothetical protein